MIIGLTGSIGSGKSFAASIFKEYGFSILDADDINSELLNSAKIQKKLQTALDIKEISKNIILKAILRNREKKTLIEQILHFHIIEKFQNARNAGEKQLFVIPLLLQLKLNYLVEHILLIQANKDIILERTKNRSMQAHEIEQMFAIQNFNKVAHLADTIIDNNTNKELFRQRIIEFIKTH